MLNDQSTLTLSMHPLASYCWKVLVALYESDTPFRAVQIHGVPKDNRAYADLWPIAKMPLLQDDELVLPETSIIIEYLQAHYPGSTILIPADSDAAREVRLWDRFFNLYVHTPMQKLVSDRLRPKSAKDVVGVEEARATLDTAYAMLDRRMAGRIWAAGDAFLDGGLRRHAASLLRRRDASLSRHLSGACRILRAAHASTLRSAGYPRGSTLAALLPVR
jgi:glutathione S-transferase